MATLQSMTRRTMKKLGVLPGRSVPTPAEYADVIVELRAMVDMWRLEGMMIYSKSIRLFDLVPGQAVYTYATGGDFDAPRPTSVESATLRDSGGFAWPLIPITAQEYSRLSSRGTVARPTRFYFNPIYPIAEVRFDTIPAEDSVELVVMDELELPATQTAELVLPPGYEDCIVYNLAIRIAADFEVKPGQEVVALAANFKALVKRKNMTMPTARIERPNGGALGTYDIRQGP